MLAHLRTNLSAIVVGVVVMTIVPIGLEKWRGLRDDRMNNATIHEMQYGDLRQFFNITSGMTANDVHADDPEAISETTFNRIAAFDISSFQTLTLQCFYNGTRMIEMKERAPIRVPIEAGEKTITIAYSLHDFGLDEFVAKGLDPRKCAFVWSKEWELKLAPGIDRTYQLQSNTFRIVDR